MLSAVRLQEGALTLQLFRLFCDVMIKAPVLEGVLAPVFPQLIQVHLGFRWPNLRGLSSHTPAITWKESLISLECSLPGVKW